MRHVLFEMYFITDHMIQTNMYICQLYYNYSSQRNGNVYSELTSCRHIVSEDNNVFVVVVVVVVVIVVGTYIVYQILVYVCQFLNNIID